MISAFTNTLKIPELRDRILFTLAMVAIVRIGAAITLPGVDATVLGLWVKEATQNADRGAAAVTALLNVFSGGALQNAAIFALGIMPYISASIMMQLLSAVVPRLNKLRREDGGLRRSINTPATSPSPSVSFRASCWPRRWRSRKTILSSGA